MRTITGAAFATLYLLSFVETRAHVSPLIGVHPLPYLLSVPAITVVNLNSSQDDGQWKPVPGFEGEYVPAEENIGADEKNPQSDLVSSKSAISGINEDSNRIGISVGSKSSTDGAFGNLNGSAVVSAAEDITRDVESSSPSTVPTGININGSSAENFDEGASRNLNRSEVDTPSTSTVSSGIIDNSNSTEKSADSSYSNAVLVYQLGPSFSIQISAAGNSEPITTIGGDSSRETANNSGKKLTEENISCDGGPIEACGEKENDSTGIEDQIAGADFEIPSNEGLSGSTEIGGGGGGGGSAGSATRIDGTAGVMGETGLPGWGGGEGGAGGAGAPALPWL